MDNEKKAKQEHFKIIAVTGCAAGIAHTYMAAEGIENSAKDLGHGVKVETHGTGGPENVFTAKDIREADIVLIAADIEINLDRFVGKKVYVTNTNLAMTDPKKLVGNAIENAKTYKMTVKGGGNLASVQGTGEAIKKSYVVRHLMYAIGWMIPVIVAGGLIMAIGNIIAIQDAWIIPGNYTYSGIIVNPNKPIDGLDPNTIYINKSAIQGLDPNILATLENLDYYWSIPNLDEYVWYTSSVVLGQDEFGNDILGVAPGGLGLPEGAVWGKTWSLYGRPFGNVMFTAGLTGLKAIYPIIAAAIAYSIAGKISFAPAFIGGYLMNNGDFLDIRTQNGDAMGTGFLGAIVIGLFVGYMALAFKKIKWPKPIKGTANLMILPVTMLFITAIMAKYVFAVILGPIVIWMDKALYALLDLGGGMIFLAILIGAMICFDLGGPVNKTAYIFGMAVFLDSVNGGGVPADWNFVPWTAVQAAISIPPLIAFFSVNIFPKYFDRADRTLGTNASIMACVGISEGAIPFAIKKPKVFVPANLIAGMISAALVTLLGFTYYGGLGSPVGAFLGYIPSTIIDNYVLGAFVWMGVYIFSALIGTLIVYAGVRFTFRNQQKNRLIKELKMETKKENKKLNREVKKLREKDTYAKASNENQINQLLDKIAKNKEAQKEQIKEIKVSSNDNFMEQSKVSKENTLLEKEQWADKKEMLKNKILAYKQTKNYLSDKEELKAKNKKHNEETIEKLKDIQNNKEFTFGERMSEFWAVKKVFFAENKETKISYKYYELKDDYKVARKEHKNRMHQVNDEYLRGIA